MITVISRARHAHWRRVACACLACTAAALVQVGCESSQPWKDPGPASVFEAFLRHGYLDEAPKAWELVSPSDREVIEAERAALKGKVPEAVLPPPHDMLAVVHLDNPYAIKKITVDPPLGDSAPAEGATVRLDVEYVSGERSEATMVWSSSRWYVDVPLEGRKQAPSSREGRAQ